MYFSSIKRNQTDGIIIVFVKSNYVVDFYEYGCNKANITKATLFKFSINPISISCVYRPPSLSSF